MSIGLCPTRPTTASADYIDPATSVDDYSGSSLPTTDLGQGLKCDIRPGIWKVLTHPAEALLRTLLPELAQLPQHHLPNVGTYWVTTLDERVQRSSREGPGDGRRISSESGEGSHTSRSFFMLSPTCLVIGPIGMGSRSGLRCGWLAQ